MLPSEINSLHDLNRGDLISLVYSDKPRLAVVNYFGPNEKMTEDGKESEIKGPRDYVNCETSNGTRTFKADKIESLVSFGSALVETM